MEAFGIGHLYVQPPVGFGNATATTPVDMVELMTLQDVSWDFKFEMKTLHGAYQFPVSVRRGKGTVEGTAKYARFRPEVWAGVFGMDIHNLPSLPDSDTSAQTFVREVTLPAVGTGTTTDTVPHVTSGATGSKLKKLIGLWYTDTGANKQLVNVGHPDGAASSATPTAGQYKCVAGTADQLQALTFTVNTADNGKVLRAVYQYSALPTTDYLTSVRFPIMNQQMGVTPIFLGGIFYTVDNTRQLVLELNRLVLNGIKFASKIDDWTYADMPLAAYADCANTIGYLNLASAEDC